MINKRKKVISKTVQLFSLLPKIGLDGFLLGILLMVVLAYYWPSPGLQEGAFTVKGIANYGIGLIFFFYGLRLSSQKLKAGLGNFRLHLLIHFSTFIVFPLIVLTMMPLFREEPYYLIWLGTFFLAALPSTVSSSVVMVSIAGGNLPAAIFNASISSLLGVFITPLWMGLVLTASSVEYDFLSVVGQLVFQVLLPVILGLILAPYIGKFAELHKARLKYFDQTIILLIVYSSFCESFARNMFQELGISGILLLSVLMILFFFLVYSIIAFLNRILRLNREDRITALFCGSKKSLVQGTVMAKVLFPGSSLLGLLLLPIMIYHAFQLIAASIIAQSMARKIAKENINSALR